MHIAWSGDLILSLNSFLSNRPPFLRLHVCKNLVVIEDENQLRIFLGTFMTFLILLVHTRADS